MASSHCDLIQIETGSGLENIFMLFTGGSNLQPGLRPPEPKNSEYTVRWEVEVILDLLRLLVDGEELELLIYKERLGY